MPIAPYQSEDELWKKLESWVPDWFFELRNINEATFHAFARLKSEFDKNVAELEDQTYITRAEAEYLDAHGAERNLTRQTLEGDPSFRIRIRELVNQNNCPAIQALVEALVVAGTQVIIREHFDSQNFCDREVFCNRKYVFMTMIYNTFSIIIDPQIHEPYSFCTREDFCDREDFVGTSESDINILATIVRAVNDAKACGIAYRLIEVIP